MSYGHQKIAVDQKGNATTTSTGDVRPAPPGYILSASSELRYFSPFPPPTVLRQYEELVPGCVAEIFKVANEQSRHRMALEAKVTDSDIERSRHGLWGATWVASLIVVAGIVAILAGHPGAGATIIGVDLTSLVGVFVYGTERRRSERIRKSDKMQIPPTGNASEIEVDDRPTTSLESPNPEGEA
jgi:uncharacterized membrane protein